MMVAMIRSGILAFGLAVVAAGGAWAQSPPSNPVLSADRMQMVSCLSQSGTAASSCIGSVAVTCVRAASGDRRAAEADCARREEVVWRERLTFAGQAVMRNADSGARGQFAALQVAWEGYAAQKMRVLREHAAVGSRGRDAGRLHVARGGQPFARARADGRPAQPGAPTLQSTQHYPLSVARR